MKLYPSLELSGDGRWGSSYDVGFVAYHISKRSSQRVHQYLQLKRSLDLD